ncbi:hypothetical protein [Rhodococcus sp. OK302]|uniref:hypothetical protein n=1 Tax=Rhodococcus sp. OK302 TaxID=1882769 RepID=UPI000B9F7753|nr:hypothetical protein [Rhodococcus sp. OK302]OYD68683.1 hypothetical protein BDB13_2237 [Rhodococcus sp. OK302]
MTQPQSPTPDNQAWSQAGPTPPQLGYGGEPVYRATPQLYPAGPDGPPPSKPGWTIVVITLCVVAAIALFGGLAVILWPKQAPSSAAAGIPSTTRTLESSSPPSPSAHATTRPSTTRPTTTSPTTTSPTTTKPTTTTAAPTTTPNAVSFPAGASACPGSGAVSGGYRESAIGSTNTSCGFAEAVRSAYGNAGVQGQAKTVDARSPVTGKEYRMTCSSAGGIVTCSGGDGAVVLLR